MEYPGTKLKKPFRRMILIFFLFLFFTISPMIVMYTAGYRYDIKNGLLKKTGAINIDINPTTSEVFINNKKINSRIPIRLNDLPSGKYTITIKNEGYFDWQKNVEVMSKETVYIKDVVLLKKNTPEIIQTGIVKDLILSPNGQYLIYSLEEENKKEIWQKNIKTEESFFVTSFKTIEKLVISFSPNESYYTISTEEIPYKRIMIINTQKPEKNLDLITYSKVPVIKYQWKDSFTPEIYYATDLQIMNFFPDNSQQNYITKNIFIDWFMEGSRLWVINKNTSTQKIEIINDVLGFATIFSSNLKAEGSSWQILKAQNNFVLLKKKNQAEMLIFEQNKKYSISGEKYLISKYNDWFIAWTSSEIWTRAKNKEPVLLNRSGMQLKQVLPLDKGNTLGLLWEENITVLFPYYLVSHELLKSKNKHYHK